MPSRTIKELLNEVQKNYTKYVNSFTSEEIVKILKKLSDIYYNTDQILVPDVIYDDLKERLEKLDPNNPYLSEVGAPIKGTKKKVKLPFEMGSLTKIKPETGDLEKWIKKFKGPYIISDKLDGVSAELYKDPKGKSFLYSRGDGVEGQDISHLISYFVDDKVLDNLPNNTAVRGELIISKNNFTKISSYMKNARNAVAGLVNSKTVDKKVASLTNFITYSILYPKYKQGKQLELLEEYGFNVVPNEKFTKISDGSMKKYLLDRRTKSIYEIDGIVCQDDSKAYDQTGGYPEHAFAFKMLLDDQIATAEVKEVEWEVSMDGYLKPRVKIIPINLAGTTVTYATGHNAKFILENKLGPGAKIKIVRSGDVIPYILGVVKSAKNAQLPPGNIKWNKTNVDIIVDENDPKFAKIIKLKLLMHFFSTMGIKYLGEGMLTKFVDAGFDTVPKIIKGLDTQRKKFTELEGVGEKMITKIEDEIKRAFNEVELPVLMAASHKFGRGIGTRKIEEVLDMYPQILLEKNTTEELTTKILQVHNFAEKSATLFANNFAKFKIFYEELSKVIDLSRFEVVHSQVSESSEEEKLFDNDKIVLTQTRDPEIMKFIKKNGGKITTGVSGNTTLVIHKDNVDLSKGKIKEAITKKIKTISVSEFKKKYGIK